MSRHIGGCIVPVKSRAAWQTKNSSPRCPADRGPFVMIMEMLNWRKA